MRSEGAMTGSERVSEWVSQAVSQSINQTDRAVEGLHILGSRSL
jgi:anti-sigma factor RsiW